MGLRAADGCTHLFQVLFSNGNATPQSYPMSRAHLYAAERAGPGG
jgi:cyclopropane-fatty-acyl-phospholipid synthase